MKTISMALAMILAVGMSTTIGAVPPASTRDALLAADRAFDAATAAKKLEGFSSFLADNVSTLRADQPVVHGKVSMQEEWKPLLENAAISIRWIPISAEVSKSGDLGYTVGTYTITRADDNGGSVVGTGKYLTIWRLQKDSTWKVEFDTGTPDSPPPQSK